MKILLATSLLFAGALSLFAAKTETLNKFIVIANDDIVSYNEKGEGSFPQTTKVGSVSALDFSGEIPAVFNIEDVPTSLTGAPVSIAIHPTRPLIIVAASMQQVIRDGKAIQVPDNRISLLRMENGALTKVTSLNVGSQPSSVSFSPDGSLAYIANRNEGSVSVIEVSETTLIERARVSLATKEASIAHIEISPDGTRALATMNNSNEILFLAINSQGLPEVIQRITAGKGPYGARFSPDGRLAVIAHIWSDEIIFFAIATDNIRETGRIKTARIPEGIDISRDGELLAVNCIGGFGVTDPEHPEFGKTGRVYLLQRNDDKYILQDEQQVPGGPQFAVFTPSGKHLLVSGAGSKKLRFFDCSKERLLSSEVEVLLPSEPVAAHRL